MPAHYKTLLTDVVTESLREAERGHELPAASREPESVWSADEVQILTTNLQGRRALSWQHADEITNGCAAQLHRSMDDVRKKAVELGMGAGVDYRFARALAAAAAV